MKYPVFLALPLCLLLVLTLAAPVAGQDLMTYSAGSCDYGGEFASIEALDQRTVRFTLCYPDPAFPSKAAFASYAIFPSEYLEATGGGGDLILHPIGTGPFRLERWDLGNEIVLTRFDDYWGEPAREQRLIFRWNAEATQRLTELQSGNVDGIDNPGTGDFGVIASDPNLALYERPGANVFYLGINNTVPPFDNLLVRQAIAHAIDRQRIVDNFYPPGSTVAAQFIPPIIFGYTEEVDPFPFDADRARELLAESGVPLPIQTTLSYRDVSRPYLEQPGVVATDLQAQLADIGINAEVVVMESGAFIDAGDRGQLSLHLLGWSADYPDATNFLDFHFGAGASEQFGAKFAEITEPLRQAAQLAAPEDRRDFYIEANTFIRDLVPMVPIAHGSSGTAFRAAIAGAHSSPLINENFSVMEDPDDDDLIWMQNGEPPGLYCADESDGEALRACEQINESLLAYEIAGTAVIPSLATQWQANDELTEWIFTLREGVIFHDGTSFDANDVVLSYAVQWDAAHPLHVGRDGSFTYFPALFGAFLNPPPD
jgi:ABC-type transport system substrate-binding protein